MNMARCTIATLLAAFLFVFAGPTAALADGLAVGQPADKYHQLAGTVYFSRSHDAKFCVSDGNDPGVLLAAAPVDLAEVCKVDLDDYGLGAYKLPAPEGASYEYECSVMQLFVYAAERFSAAGAEGIEVNGEPGSAFFKRYWGADDNFLYYVNGMYPMGSALGEGSGATADMLRLKDGDVVSVAHYTDRSFYTDEVTGFHFFLDADGAATHTYVAKTGADVEVRLARASGDADAGVDTAYVDESDWTVWWGSVYDQTTGNATAAGSAKTDEQGAAMLRFDEPGTYWAWADGGNGKTVNAVVSSPAAVRIVVSDDPAPCAAMPKGAPGLVYDGSEQTGVAASEGVVLSGRVSAVDAGSYTVLAVPADGWTWPDGTRSVKEVDWEIGRAPIAGAQVALDVSGQRPSAVVTLGGKTLVAHDAADGADFGTGGGDCLVAFGISCDAAASTSSVRVDVTGMGNYSGTTSAEAACAACPLSLVLSPARAAYTGRRVTPVVEVGASGGVLASGDFELRYINVASGSSSRVAPTAVGSYRVVALLSQQAAARLGYASAGVFTAFEIFDPNASDPDPGSEDSGGQGDAGDQSGSDGGQTPGPAPAAKIDISKATVEIGKLAYTGKALKPEATVKLSGKALEAGAAYSLGYLNAGKKPIRASDVKAAGVYYAKIAGMGAYGGSVVWKFKVAKAKNTFAAKAKAAKKAVTVKAGKALAAKKYVKVGKPAFGGKLSYKLGKAPAKLKKHLKVATKTGKITVAKKAKSGTYTVKLKITSKASPNYTDTTRTVKLKLKVK